MSAFIRPALVTPVTNTMPVTVNLADDQMNSNGQIVIAVTNLPVGAWIISSQTIMPNGKVFPLPDGPACQPGTQQQCTTWFATRHLPPRPPPPPPPPPRPLPQPAPAPLP